MPSSPLVTETQEFATMKATLLKTSVMMPK